MKQLFLLVFGTISVLFVDAQSQTISGTLLPKKGESVTYLPKASETQKPDASKQAVQQQDTTAKKTVAKKVIQTGNEKPIVKTKVPAAKAPVPKGFIFNLPIVQGASNTQTNPPVTPLATEEPKPADVSKTNTVAKPVTPVSIPVVTVQPQTVATNNTVPTPTKKTDNEPLKYEEPPTGSASWAVPPSNSAPAKLEPLVYGPPPVSDATTASPTNTTASDKKANLRSPKFKGVYKPALKKPILLVPMSPDDMEDGVPKKKETEPTANVVEKPKSVEDLYPPLNYTAPIPAAASNLRSPKIQGTYVASKSNPMILMPVPPEPTNGQQQKGSTLIYQEPPVQTYNNPTNTNVTPSRTEQASSSQPNIFDENYRGKPAVASKTIYTKYKKNAPKKAATKPATNKPASTSIKQPVKNNFKKTFLKPVRQSVNGSVSFNHPLFKSRITSLMVASC
jgi:hypothetical protein